MVIGLRGVQFGLQSYSLSRVRLLQIGLHEVLLPINYKKYNLREEKYSQVMNERENFLTKELVFL